MSRVSTVKVNSVVIAPTRPLWNFLPWDGIFGLELLYALARFSRHACQDHITSIFLWSSVCLCSALVLQIFDLQPSPPKNPGMDWIFIFAAFLLHRANYSRVGYYNGQDFTGPVLARVDRRYISTLLCVMGFGITPAADTIHQAFTMIILGYNCFQKSPGALFLLS